MTETDGSHFLSSAATYRAVISETADALLVISAENRVIDATPEIFDHFGYTRDEIIGQDGFTFLHPDDVDRCAQVLLHEMMDTSWRGPAIPVMAA